jgi:dipeptidyl-peptidase-4
MADSFPRQQARTRRFTLGAPRTFTVSPDGDRVVFLRSGGGSDAITALWELDMDKGEERMLVDPGQLSAPGPGGEPASERARRERRRESAGGIVAYSCDRDLRLATFALAGQLWVADLASATSRPLQVDGPVFDPRMDPTGSFVAYVADRTLRVVAVQGGRGTPGDGTPGEDRSQEVAGEEDPDVSWGQAEFVAAEEMSRDRGFWWSPDGRSLLVARVDIGPVATWWIAEPAHPERPPRPHRYPAAGTANAQVTLHHVVVGGPRREVVWDRSIFPYLVAVQWTSAGPPLLVVERRNHREVLVLGVDLEGPAPSPASDPAAGPATDPASDPEVVATSTLARSTDPDWVELPFGLPAWLSDGRLLWAADIANTTRLVVDGVPITPIGLQVRAVVGTDTGVVFSASSVPESISVWRWSPDEGLEGITEGGVATAVGAGVTTVVAIRDLDRPRADFVVTTRHGASRAIRSYAEVPMVAPNVRFLSAGSRQLRTGVLLPSDHQPGRSLPAVLCPYGGPGAQMVLNARSVWLEAQWLADQGFAVVVADGRGTPGRGPAWARAVKGDLAGPVLDDQVDALAAAAEAIGDLDLGRVGIRGWSFGGYLAALAVLRRPDVFHAAVAGAPVTHWQLYDTYYTERYLDHPGTSPEGYARSSLLGDAASLRRPLLLVHGLADDNVVVAHSLQLSQHLFEAGRPHQFLGLSGVTHMASGEDIAEHLLELQVGFLRDALG